MSKKAETGTPSENTKTEPSSTSTSTQDSTTNQGTGNQATSQNQEDLTSKGIFEEVTSKEPPVEGAPAVETSNEATTETTTQETEFEPYELELAEDSPLTDAEFDEIVSEAERLKLSKEDAEKFIQMREFSHKASKEVFENELKQRVNDMAKTYRAEASLHTVEAKLSMREAIKTFGTDPAFVDMFKDPMLNFHIPLAKFLISVGDRLREGSNNMPVPKKSAPINSTELDPLERAASNFYKDM